MRRLHAWLLVGGLLAGLCRPVSASSPPQLPEAVAALDAANWPLTPASRLAYAELLKLRVPAARALVRAELQRTPTNASPLLVADCIDLVELLISQDARLYDGVVAAQDQRLATLARSQDRSALRAYALAEIRLHQAAAQVIFQHEIQGAWSLRQSFLLMQEAVRQHPGFLPARKTLGLLQFFIGSLPESYRWFLRLLGLPGSIDSGMQNLRAAARQPNDFQLESRMILALVEETYYKRGEASVQLATQLAAQQPDNLLFTFLVMSLQKKQHHTEPALAAYRARPTGATYLPVPYLHHMAADLLLYQGNYAASERENLLFLREFRGQHYHKDAYFKLYLAAWLAGKPTAARQYYQQIDAGGRTVVEEDTYAQRVFDDKLPLNALLTRARLQIDGGYYREALHTLNSFQADRAPLLRDRLEAPYRTARAWQGLGSLDSARLFYARTIALAGSAPYYFAPQSALQLGYLYQAEGQRNLARTYFQKALSYPRHEYKNSTDTKAKVALKSLE